MSKVLKEFAAEITVTYPKLQLPQDIIDAQVMPALRRSYDRARRENWRMAKATTAKFDMLVGPVEKVWSQSLASYYYEHHFGWYVSVELEEEATFTEEIK